MDNLLPKVSVITVNFNGKEYLTELFESLAQLNYPENKIDIIFVDNVSSDGSVDFVRQHYQDVRVVENDVNSYCKAINLGIRASDAEFVALVNNDTKVDKNWLIELVDVITRDENIAAVGSKILGMDGKIQNASYVELPNFYLDERGAGREADNYENEEEVKYLCGASVLYRRKAIVQVGLFDEDFVMFYEDIDMSVRLRANGYKLLFAPKSIIFHKFHGSCTEEFAKFLIEKNRLLFLAKHYPDKLSNALLGNGYFIAKDRVDSVTGIYSIMADLIFQLLKYHPLEVSKNILHELVQELGKIVNYENKILSDDNKERVSGNLLLAEDVKKLQAKLEAEANLVQEKNKEIALNTEKQLRDLRLRDDVILEKSNEVALKSEELNVLFANFQARMDELLCARGELIEKSAEVVMFKEELSRLAEEIADKIVVIEEKDKAIESLAEAKNKEIALLAEAKNSEIAYFKNELAGIYGSTGYRFVLRPLWKASWEFKKFSKSFFRKTISFFWIMLIFLLTPVFIGLSFLFFIECFVWISLKPLFIFAAPKRKAELQKSDRPSVSIVIPNYNGIGLLKECLSSIFSSGDVDENKDEVVVVDDGSRDASVEFIRTNFPKVRLILNNRNRGFGFTCNRGVREAKNETVVLINNDIMMEKGYLAPLIRHLMDKDVFVSTPKLFGWDKKTFAWGMHVGHFENGHIRLWNESETGNQDRIYKPSPSIFAIGGAMVFRKSDFIWMGGFDSIYRPNCWEDIDISYRALKRGLKVVYEPSSVMYHKGRATLTYERPKEIKNELLFTWKNITDWKILINHLNLLPRNIYFYRMPYLKGFFWAMKLLSQTLVHRFLERRYIVQPEDGKIFKKITGYYEDFVKNGFSHSQPGKPNILLVSRFLPYPLNVGGKLRIYSLCKQLADRYNFILLSLIDHVDELNYVPELKKVFKEVYAIQAEPPQDFSLFVKLFYPNRYKIGYSYSRQLISKFKEIQNMSLVDIVHIESNELLYLADLVKNAPLVYTEHDVSFMYPGKSYYKRNGNFIFRFIDYLKRLHFHTMQLQKVDKVITLSRQDEVSLNALFPSKDVSLIHTGVDINYFNYSYKVSKAKKLIFVGHYLHYPNEEAVVHFVKKVFPLIRKSAPDAEFVIVGSNPTAEVRGLAKVKNVTVVGEVLDVREYLKDAAVFVSDIHIGAGIKGKVLEAMATGVPVVSTKLGCYGIEAFDGKEILIAKDEKDFANKVVMVLGDENLRKNLAVNARLLVENKYDGSKIADKLGVVYKNILPERISEEKKSVFVSAIIEQANNFVEERISSFNGRSLAVVEEGPRELHLELTYNCNSKCVMCDLWDHKDRASDPAKKEMSLEDIKNFVENSRYLRKTKTVVLSGGEPFLRHDIVDICGFFIKNLPYASFGILTNALDAGKVIDSTKQILDRFQPRSFWLGSSLDGVGEGHDRIRGRQGAFLEFNNTLERLRKELPSVKFSTTFTITPNNVDQLLPAMQFAKQQGLDFFAQFVVPKQARGEFVWVEHDLNLVSEQIQQILQEIIVKAGQNGKEIFDRSGKIADKHLISQIYYWSNLLKYQRNPSRYFKKCIAGSQFAMLNPYGDLFFCPLLKNRYIGNVVKDGFDALWISKEANRVRDFIEEESCHCWLVCVIFPLLEKIL